MVLRAARRGDPAALETLYDDLAPGVVGYLRAHRAAEPEDLASEVFLAMIRGLRRFRGQEPAFRSWIFTIAHHRLVDERRRPARRREQATAPDVLGGLGEVGDAEGEAMARLEAAWVVDAVSRLTDDQRAVVLLRVLVGFSVAEVAEILRKTQPAVKMLQQRGLSRLARLAPREAVT